MVIIACAVMFFGDGEFLNKSWQFAVETYQAYMTFGFFLMFVYFDRIDTIPNGKILLIFHGRKYIIDLSDDSDDFKIKNNWFHYGKYKESLYINDNLKKLVYESIKDESNRESYSRIIKLMNIT
jgi:hypothetical protein